MAHRRRRQPQRHGRGVLPQEGRAGLEGRAAAAAHRQRADQRERAAVRDAERVCGQHLRSRSGHRVRGAVRADRSRRRRRQAGAASSRCARAPSRCRPRAGRSITSIRRTIKGQRQEPAFTGLLAAYYTGSSHSDNFNTYPPRVQPGDTILVHAGVYKDDRFRYGGGLGHGLERHLLPDAERHRRAGRS